jgi:RNA polymerase sigma factor (sigma-70 family)
MPAPVHPWSPHLATLRPQALRWLAGRGFDPVSAEDLWQDLCECFLRTAAVPDGSQAPQAYLWLSLRRAAGRAQSRWTPRFDERGLVAEVDPGPSPAESMQRKEQSNAVRDAVADLPPKFRVVVERRFLGGESLAQVADALAIPGATVATRTHRGLALLRGRLASYRRALIGALVGLARRAALVGLLVAVGIGPVAEVAVSEPHRPVPLHLEGQPTWLRDAPTAGFPYADFQFVARPMPEA